MSNIQPALDISRAFNRGDIATVLGEFDPDIKWRKAEAGRLP